MAGSEPFFGGKIVVRVTAARGIGHGYTRQKRSFVNGPTGAGAFDAAGNRDEQTKADEQDAQAAYSDYAKAKVYVGTPLPPVTLHLILINPGDQAVTATILDFESELGNFVLDPDKLVVEAGLSAEPTPMVSQLGVTSDNIPVTVTLKVGSTKETHVIQMKNLLGPDGKPKPQ